MTEESRFSKREIIITGDGSSSVFLPDAEEHYHSVHGAVQESRHVFLKSGLDEVLKRKKDVKIFEMGFGTGLNAFLTFFHVSETKDVTIDYYAIDAYPVEEEIWSKVNYSSAVNAEQAPALYKKMHETLWGQTVFISEKFRLNKQHATLETAQLPEHYFDLIYYDAFAPRVQPELWTTAVFQKMYSILAPGGILVTYCSKGDVRRAMLAAGLSVEKIPGPPGKREMLRAKKK
ncbi:MAG: tRNA (5-methylaminomethyl-2-thiouridine)(34)-methyltransferase MnmD [Bacteroidia bacterium]